MSVSDADYDIESFRTGSGDRSVYKTFTSKYSDIDSTQYVSGFQFISGDAYRLDTGITGTRGSDIDLIIRTLGETKLRSFRVGVLIFKRST